VTNYNPPRVHLFWLAVGAILLWLSFNKDTFASDHYYRDDDGDVEVITEVVTGDNINSGGSHKSLALVNSLGDVDINDCVISKQLSVIVFARQSYDYNLWCMALNMDKVQKYDEAATVRCLIPDIKKAFPDDCEHSMRFEPEIIELPELDTLYSQAAQYDEDENERQQVREEQQADINILMERFAALERRASRYAAAERVKQVKLDEDREYARAELERLKEYRQ